MSNNNAFHALGLHMHQPPGNLRLLIETDEWEARQIICCYERAARYARTYADVARFHVGFSGILLEQLRDPWIVDRYRRFVDIPAMLEAYRCAPNIELIGMGYFHPLFPLTPQEDWADQLVSGRQIMEDAFGRAPRGFWPPEMAFSMEMVPALAKAGYEYVVVDGVHVKPAAAVPDVYRAYVARFGEASIRVIPRDRDLSNAQQSGLDAGWFANEVSRKIAASPEPHAARLVTTWSDGENGGWFRQLDEGSGFFGHYFAPYMERVRANDYPVRPTLISEFLQGHPPAVEAHVQTGAWNIGQRSGHDFSQWAGSQSQRRALERVFELSGRYWALCRAGQPRSPAAQEALTRARRLILEAQTSCFLFWGESWIPKLHERADAAASLLSQAAS